MCSMSKLGAGLSSQTVPLNFAAGSERGESICDYVVCSQREQHEATSVERRRPVGVRTS